MSINSNGFWPRGQHTRGFSQGKQQQQQLTNFELFHWQKQSFPPKLWAIRTKPPFGIGELAEVHVLSDKTSRRFESNTTEKQEAGTCRARETWSDWQKTNTFTAPSSSFRKSVDLAPTRRWRRKLSSIARWVRPSVWRFLLPINPIGVSRPLRRPPYCGTRQIYFLTTMPRLLARRRSRKNNNDHVTPYPNMAAKERRDHTSNAKLCIGNYLLGTTLGVGTFGKVKRKYSDDLACLW